MASEVLTDEEKAGVSKIRDAMKGKIPRDLDTDYNLRRWWSGNHGKMADIVPRMSLYIENRRVLGFDRPDFLETFYEEEKTRTLINYFGMSRLNEHWVNRDNGIVFVESGEFDKKVVSVMTTGSYLETFFGLCEYVLRMILKQEAKTGKPSHGICIFDMGKVDLGNHLNPLSPCNKVFKTRAIIWQEFYPDMIRRIVVVNPPYFVGMIWTVIRFLLNEHAQKLLFFAHKKDGIFEVLDPQVTPVAFGGQLKDTTGWSDRDDCCNERKAINESQFYVDGTIWKSLGIDTPHSETISIKPNKVYALTRIVDEPTVIAWHFWANGEVDFGVSKVNEGDGDHGGVLVYPRLKLVTTKVPEEGQVKVDAGTYRLEFANTSHYFGLKIDVAIVGGKAGSRLEIQHTHSTSVTSAGEPTPQPASP
uniref:CRAL-TRIO domain-containing protein n=1 Tax=Plectus sambesii TaxID=2011161 RepID=A0A914VGD9_9BILA